MQHRDTKSQKLARKIKWHFAMPGETAPQKQMAFIQASILRG